MSTNREALDSTELKSNFSSGLPTSNVSSGIFNDQRKQMQPTGPNRPSRDSLPSLTTSSSERSQASRFSDRSHPITTSSTTSGAVSYNSSENIRSPIDVSEQLVPTASPSEELYPLTDALEKLEVSRSDELEHNLPTSTWYPDTRNEVVRLIDSKLDQRWDTVREKIKVYPVSSPSLHRSFLTSDSLCSVHYICPPEMA